MKFRVEELGEEPTTHLLDEEEGWFARLGLETNPDRVAYESPIHFDILLLRSGRDIDVRGTVSGMVKIACSRCLVPHGCSLSSDFHVLLVPEDSCAAREEGELDRNSLELTPYRGEEIDLDETLREQLLLALPARSLCREECRGFCSCCGVNRNETECSCEAPEAQSSFARLREFKLKR